MNNGPKNARWRVVAKSRENIVLGSLEQAIPECFRNLSRFARSGFRRAKWSRPMQITAPRRPSFSLRVGGPIDPTPILRPDHRANPGKQTMPRSGNHQYNDPSAQICDHSMAGSQKQAIPEDFRNLSCFARSGFRGQNEAHRCRSPPPTIVLAAGWKTDCPTPILRPDHRADPGRQTTPRSGDN